MLTQKIFQIFMASIFTLGIGCVKKREEKFIQGQGEDLVKVANLDGQEITIQTGGPVLDVQGEKIENCERSIVSSDEIEEINTLKWIVAKPNKTYKARVSLVENKMIVYKITPKQDLMECERPSATKEAEGYLVPVAQFQVEYVKVEKEKDFNDDPTSRLYEKRVKKDEAQFVRIAPYSGRSFGEELYPQDYIAINDVEKLLSLKVKIKTKEVLKRFRSFRVKENTQPRIETKKYKFYKNLDEVTYEVVGDNYNLLEGARIFGKINQTFDVKFILEGDFIVAYKMGNLSNLTQLEIDIAKEEKNQFLVPIRSYSVQFFRLTQDLDSLGVPKPELGKQALLNAKGATHFIIRKDSGKNFSNLLQERQNLWPLEYLMDSEWYYDKTLVDKSKTKEGWGAALGMSEDHSWEFGDITKVRFRLVEESSSYELHLINSADANETRREFMTKEETFSDIQTKEFLTKLTPIEFKEEVLTREFQQVNKNKTYVNIPFSGEVMYDLHIEDDYMSYTLLTVTSSTVEKYRVSFKRVTPNLAVKPRVYHKEHWKKFGFFAKEKPEKRENIKKEGDRILHINRFYPVDGVIQYYFSQESTRDPFLRSLAVKAINNWNRAFKDANTGITLRIDERESADKPLGDIRYNVVNLVDAAEGRLRGYGPSKQDPHTGEIISASANVYTNSFIESHMNLLRSYIRFRRGRLDDKYIYSAGGEANRGLFTKESIRENKNSPFVLTNYKSLETIFDTPECTAFLKYAEDLTANYQPKSTLEERQIFDPCSKHALSDEFVLVITHELGHNFGLRHNFMASNDWHHFPAYSQGAHPYDIIKGASVMDYYPSGFNNPVEPGQYDRAALAFGYGPLVPDQNTNLKQVYGEFKYCTDEDVYDERGDINYLVDCLRHDYGATIDEIVENRINDLKSMMAERLHRDQQYRWMGNWFGRNAWIDLFKSMSLDLHRVYAAWRKKLAEYISVNSALRSKYNPERLGGLSKEEFNNLVENQFLQDAKFKNYASYKMASQKVFDFYKEFINSTDRYCVVDNTAKARELVRLSDLRTEIYLKENRSIVYCDDDATTAFLRDQGLNLMGAVGLFHEDVMDTQDPMRESLAEISVVGTIQLRRRIRGIVAGGDTGKHVYKMQDDPNYREQVIDLLGGQILKQEKTADILKPLALAEPEGGYVDEVYNRYLDEDDRFFEGTKQKYQEQLTAFKDGANNSFAFDKIRVITNDVKDDGKTYIVNAVTKYYESEDDSERSILLERAKSRQIDLEQYVKPVPFNQTQSATALKGSFAAEVLKRYSELDTRKRNGEVFDVATDKEFNILFYALDSWKFL